MVTGLAALTAVDFSNLNIPSGLKIRIAMALAVGADIVQMALLATRVRTIKNEHVWDNVVDANTGVVTAKEVVSSLKALDREDLANIAALKWIKQELSDAVQVAERAAAGSALAGGLMRQDGKLNFVVVVASGDHLKEVTLEPPKVGAQGSSRH